ncbi:DUF6607 family protein [Parvularcula lutaonensis]|uniref:DUF6607 family protein n=1 Tax=Parvularcula lutaonensis TaxID=491923 RepID=A0ABV7M6W1_9PROT|nr:DUF6607 family protein [Parvularcula lutaonensis]GGY56845.1 hypothetical protein GCM10007148_27950 [Parvularcula lutaonensis]
MSRRFPCAAMAALLGLSALSACTTASEAGPSGALQVGAATQETFARDRESILAMAGNYKVTFDFEETVAFDPDYELKEPKLSGGYEVVRVIEDDGDFISLQHLLVVGPEDQPFVVKHWRQDWRYQPERVLTFIGGNAWEWRDVPEAERKGAWSQTVYQVDDAPRYGAVGAWRYEGGLAEWMPDKEWRPLPRRDMTTRDDYHAIDAVNRHVITQWGWVHEQDNAKLVLSGDPMALVREIGVNTYRRYDDFPVSVANEYWAATANYWAGVRDIWQEIEEANDRFAITLKGETEELYRPLLGLAAAVQEGEMDEAEALAEAERVIAGYVTPDVGRLAERLRTRTELASSH